MTLGKNNTDRRAETSTLEARLIFFYEHRFRAAAEAIQTIGKTILQQAEYKTALINMINEAVMGTKRYSADCLEMKK